MDVAIDFIAGCMGGVAGVLVGHPFDTIKVRLQTQTAENRLYRGTLHCCTEIVKKESVFGLYKGILSPMYGLTAINAIVFGVQGNVQRNMKNPDALTSHFLAGAIAGTSQSIICSPMELAKTRMQVQGQGEKTVTNKMYNGPIDCLRKLYKAEGIRRGVFRGLGLTIIREAPSFGCYFVSYEYLCRCFDKDNGKPLSTPVLLFAGGIAGMVSWFVTYPIDVIKSRIQGDIKNEYKNTRDCIWKSYKAEGMICFSRGLGATMIRAFPVNAATFATVTQVLRLADLNKDTTDDPAIPISELPPFEQHQYTHHAHVHQHEVDLLPVHP